jgi:hypothetical protein
MHLSAPVPAESFGLLFLPQSRLLSPGPLERRQRFSRGLTENYVALASIFVGFLAQLCALDLAAVGPGQCLVQVEAARGREPPDRTADSFAELGE